MVDIDKEIDKEDINHIKEVIKETIDLNINKKMFNKMTEEVIHLCKIVKIKMIREENLTTNKLMNFKMTDLLLFKKSLMFKTTIINLDIKESNMVIKKELPATSIDC